MTSPDRSERRYSEEEVGRLLRRAVELQQDEAPAPGIAAQGLTLAELEQVAREAGIEARHLRDAAAEIEQGPVASELAGRLAGAPTSFAIERSVPGELSSGQLEELVPLVQAEALGQGSASLVGRTLTWTSRSDANTSSQQVTVSSRDGETRIRIDERLAGYAGGLFGGLMGGVGLGAGVPVGIVIGGALGSLAVTVGFPVAVIAGGYGAARAFFSAHVRSRRRRMEALARRLADRIAAQTAAAAEPALPGGSPESDEE